MEKTIAGRVKLLLTWSGKSARALARDAGLSPNTVNTMLLRDSNDIRPETLSKIARAAGVRLEWLMTGEGHPFERPAGVEPDIDYPSRSWALGLAYVEGVSPAVVRRLKARRPDSDPGAWFWVDLLRTLIAEDVGASGAGPAKKKAAKHK